MTPEKFFKLHPSLKYKALGSFSELRIIVPNDTMLHHYFSPEDVAATQTDNVRIEQFLDQVRAEILASYKQHLMEFGLTHSDGSPYEEDDYQERTREFGKNAGLWGWSDRLFAGKEAPRVQFHSIAFTENPPNPQAKVIKDASRGDER